MKFRNDHQQKGSVVLVAMCFVAVLGIALASYLAVSNQAMKLSNRSYQKSVSEQLAEIGLEETLRAFNTNNWSDWSSGTPPNVTSSDWTLDNITKRATCLITFPLSKFGPGIDAAIRIRVDNYDAPTAVEWTATGMYGGPNVLVYSKISAWNFSAKYVPNDVVSSGGFKYRCIATNAGQTPPSATYWTKIPLTEFIDFRSWYRWSGGALLPGKAPPDSNYWINSTPVIYAEGIVTPPGSSGPPLRTQLRAQVSIAPLFPNAVGTTGKLDLQSAGTIDSYDPSLGTTGYSAVLASTGTSNPSVTVTGVTVKGYIAAPSSSAFASLTSFGGSASLKNGIVISPHASAPNVDLTRISRSPYVPQFDPRTWSPSTVYHLNDVVRASDGKLYVCKAASTTLAPTTLADWIQPQLLATQTIGDSSGTIENYWYSGDLNLTSDTNNITIEGPVVLDIQGALYIRNNAEIKILTTGSAEIQFSGRLSVGSVSTPANGINNLTKDPKKLILAGSIGASPYPHRYFSNQPFYGVIYMPNITSPLSVFSGAFFGAISAKSVTFPSTANLHYDPSLLTASFHSVDTPYTIVAWRELTDAAEQVTFP